jgi:hypothetical protein
MELCKYFSALVIGFDLGTVYFLEGGLSSLKHIGVVSSIFRCI